MLLGLESARPQYKLASSSLSGHSGCFLETHNPLITPTPWGSTWHFQQETAWCGSSCFICFFYLSWKRLQIHLVNALPVGHASGTISHPRSPAEAAVCKSLHVHPAGGQVTPAEGCGCLEKQDSGGFCRACVFSLLRGMLFTFRSLETKGARTLPKGFFIPFLQKFHYQGEKRMCCFDFFFLLANSHRILLLHKDLRRNTCSVLKSKVSTSWLLCEEGRLHPLLWGSWKVPADSPPLSSCVYQHPSSHWMPIPPRFSTCEPPMINSWESSWEAGVGTPRGESKGCHTLVGTWGPSPPTSSSDTAWRGTGRWPSWLRDMANFSPGYACPDGDWLT